MRLFTGITLSSNVVERLGVVVDPLRPVVKVKWSPPENFHITTKFLGEWPEEHLGEVLTALKHMPSPGPFAVDVEGLGLFPDEHSPRVLFARVAESPELFELARRTDVALAGIGVTAGKHEYAPHVTLARIGNGKLPARLAKVIASESETRFGRVDVSQFHLYLSEHSAYRQLAHFDLSEAL